VQTALGNMIRIGNTFEECAYHEAGHGVAAGVLGLAFKPTGITIVEVTDGAFDGQALYWEDDPGYEKTLVALGAGEWTQLRQFPQSSAVGSLPDTRKFCEIVRVNFDDPPREVKAKIYSRIEQLIETHWGAVIAVVRALSDCPWMPSEPSDHVKGKRKKRLHGATLVTILTELGISAHVRDNPKTT
jgi:hypothetical protein